MSCPPCNGNCRQGRECPRKRKAGLVALALLWAGIWLAAPIVMVVA